MNKYPRTIFIEIGTECNSNCKYCHMWTTKETAGGLTTEEKIKIIREFKKNNPDGKIVLTGGETMLKYDEFFNLSMECTKWGLFCAANTNASLINDKNIEKILKDGPKYLVVSLDSHIEKYHEYSRGIDGGFEHATDVLKKLVKAKKENKSKVEILTNSVIYDMNIDGMVDYIDFVEKLGIDGCIFQMISKTFFLKGEQDYFFKNHFFKDKVDAQNKIQNVIDILDNHKIVRTTKQDFEWMKLYINNPDFIGEQVCGSYEKNIMVDTYGEMQLCFNMKNINNGKSLGNVREFNYNVVEAWNSEKASNARVVMKNCRLNCGILNCHRKK